MTTPQCRMTALPSTEDLARLAKAITPGPWKAGRHPWPTQVGCCPLPGRPYEISHEMRNLAAANTIADAEAIALLPALLREVLDRREAEAWRPETNILPWVALTIEQMRRFEASSGDLERLGLNGEWIPTDTPLSPGLIYRINSTPTTEASHGE